MRIACPHCGERGNEEFDYYGDANLVRPAADAPLNDHADYVFLRDNPAGVHRELWQHIYACRAWLVVTRDTRNHDIVDVKTVAADRAAKEAAQ